LTEIVVHYETIIKKENICSLYTLNYYSKVNYNSLKKTFFFIHIYVSPIIAIGYYLLIPLHIFRIYHIFDIFSSLTFWSWCRAY